jgi:hypothetical protein
MFGASLQRPRLSGIAAIMGDASKPFDEIRKLKPQLTEATNPQA